MTVHSALDFNLLFEQSLQHFNDLVTDLARAPLPTEVSGPVIEPAGRGLIEHDLYGLLNQSSFHTASERVAEHHGS